MYIEKTIAVVVPAYNEEKYIQGVIESCSSYAMDIIIVDDGSSDSTAEKVRSSIPLSGNSLKLIVHPENMGKGRALITGFEYIIENNYTGIDLQGKFDKDENKEDSNFRNTNKKNTGNGLYG